MTLQAAKILVGRSDVAVIDEAVAAARGEDVVVPCKRTNTGSMTCHGSQTTAAFGIPDLDKAFVGAYSKMRAALDPGHRSYRVVLQFTEFGDTASLRIPHVNTGAKADAKDIAAAPVYKV